VRQPHLTSRLQGFGTTIFSTITALALDHDAVNLGQGFPDEDGPDLVLEAAVDAIRSGKNQYAPGIGVRTLRHAIADHQQRFHGLTYDAETEVTVSAGATEALAATFLALCEVGDEVILFEPYYDCYRADVAMTGAVHRAVTLRAPDYHFDPAELAAAFTDKTRLLVLNSPHNPTGKVFTDEELALIARLCVEHDVVAVTDEVYEHLTFDAPHRSLATFPGMRERTVVISSAAKTFSVTGWKVGWLCAPPALTAAVRTAKQFLSFANGTPFQHAVAGALALGDDYFERFRATYRVRRDRLCGGLADVGFDVMQPDGTYFVTVDIRPLGYDDGIEFCMDLPKSIGVAAVPNVVFYDDKVEGAPLVRFAFCKTDAVLDEGLRRLSAITPRRGGA
jgi:N-succinyldiaminopimelate aminotransferase